MKKLLIVGNFKSNKTSEEASEWFKKFLQDYREDPQKEIIICPSFTSLSIFSKLIQDSNFDIFLGAQNVSSFKEGPYTGEVNARQIKEFCKYSLVGHSERRQKFFEDKLVIDRKLANLENVGITPILCISDLSQLNEVNLKNCIIAYEPIHSVGTGEAQNPQTAEEFLEKIRRVTDRKVLYGGSVDSENVSSYTSSFDGVLVGAESLDPLRFLEIINNA